MSPPSILSGLRPLPSNIAVFRALQLGDMLCSVPALRALRQALPHAHITLIGLPNATGFVQRFSRYLDDLMVFPGLPGMPEQAAREDALPAFYAQARARRFDLAIQLHGSGGLTNPIVQQLGARHCAGFVPQAPGHAQAADAAPGMAGQPGCSPADHRFFMPWPDHLPEILRYTALMHRLGIPVDSTELEFPLSAEDHAGAIQLLQAHRLDPHRTVLVHPGARLPSRRWPAQRFAQVASRLAAQGWQIAVTGSQDERPITQSLLAAMRDSANQAGAALQDEPERQAALHDTATALAASVIERVRISPPVDLTGATSLGVLAALVARCRLVVTNDTGMSHVAAAVQAPSVVVASGSDVNRWAPLNRQRHTVLWQDMPCRPCAHHDCPLPDHPCAQGIAVDDVARHADSKLVRRTAHA